MHHSQVYARSALPSGVNLLSHCQIGLLLTC